MNAISSRNGSAGTIPAIAVLLAAAAICALLFTGCRSESAAPRNILLISIDTCRADHLGSYGFELPTTPNIDALAHESVLFRNVVSPVPLTLPAHCSLLTGVNSPGHGVHDNFDFRLGPALTTLPEILRREGFRTGAVISSSVMDAQFGLDRGFDDYEDKFEKPHTWISEHPQRRGDETTRVAEAWIERHAGGPFFLFLHYYDPHTDYDPPEPYASRFAGNPYAGEIAFTDACIGRIVDRLKSLGLYDSTLIIVTGDHGEGLLEHGENTHGFFIYNTCLMVPLVIKPPGGTEPRSIDSVAGLVDVVPTICGFVGVEPPAEVHGVDLSPLIAMETTEAEAAEAEAAADRLLYCESRLPTKYGANPLHGVVGDRWKYILTTRPELYDLKADPGEAENLAAQVPDAARGLRAGLEKMLADMQAAAEGVTDAGSRFVTDAETRAKLQALGYVSGGIAEDAAFDPGLDDPKDLIAFHVSYKKISYLIADGQLDEAVALCRELIEQRPQYHGTYGLLVDAALRKKDFASAVPALLKLIEIEPVDGPEFNLHKRHYQLALCYLNLGDLEKSAAGFESAVAAMPGDVPAANRIDVLEKLGWIWTELERDDRAVDYFARALEIDPSRPQAHYNLALTYYRTKDLAKAERHCRTILEAMPGEINVRHLLGKVLAERGAQDEAVAQLEEALEKARAQGLTDRAAEIEQTLESIRK